MKRSVLCLSLVVATAVTAAHAMSPVTPAALTNPDWVERPNGQDVLAAYSAAIKNGSSGAASVRCQVSSQGRLGQCVVVRQTSAGFGEAALRLTPLFRMRLSTADGQPVAGREITVPFHFGQDD